MLIIAQQLPNTIILPGGECIDVKSVLETALEAMNYTDAHTSYGIHGLQYVCKIKRLEQLINSIPQA